MTYSLSELLEIASESKVLKSKYEKALQEIDDLQVQNRNLSGELKDISQRHKRYVDDTIEIKKSCLDILNSLCIDIEVDYKVENYNFFDSTIKNYARAIKTQFRKLEQEEKKTNLESDKYASHLICNIMRDLKIDFPMIVVTNQTEKDILERRIQDLKNGFTVLQNRIGYVESLIANSKSENEKLKTQNQNLKSENQKWETDYQKLYDRNIALKTDSANYKKDIEVLESEKEYFKNCWINADRIARRLAKALDDIRQIINPPLESYTE